MQTELEDCAEMFIDIARNNSMTGQAITIGKFSHARMWSFF